MPKNFALVYLWIQSYTNKIDHQDPNLRVTTIIVGSRGESSYERAYSTDAKEQKRTDAEGDEFTTMVKWEGNVLVFETVEKERGGTITTRKTWTPNAWEIFSSQFLIHLPPHLVALYFT